MTWFKVDDNLAFHAKVVAAGNPAMGLWVRAGSWSAHTLTDGRIPAHMIPALGTSQQAKALVRVGLWTETDDGFQFHQWADGERQPTKEAIETKRAEWREKKRKQRRGTSGQFVPEVSPEDSTEDKGESPLGSPTVPSRPVPSRPVPTTNKTAADASAQTLIGEWIDHCTTRPPSRLIGQLSKEVKTLLDDGIPYDTVRRGLAAWHDKGLHPSTLASVVHEASKAPKRGTTDQRVQDALDLASRLRAEEESTTAQIGA